MHVLLFGFLNTPSKIYKSARINSTYHFKFSKFPLRLIASFEISKVFIALCVHFIGFKVWLSFNLINDSFRSASSPFRMSRLDFGRFPSRCVRRQNVAFAIATLSVNKLNVVWSVLLWTILFCSALFRVFFYFAVDDDGLLAEFGTQKSIQSMILYVIIMKGFSRGNPTVAFHISNYFFVVHSCQFLAVLYKLACLDASTFNCILSCLQILSFSVSPGCELLNPVRFSYCIACVNFLAYLAFGSWPCSCATFV